MTSDHMLHLYVTLFFNYFKTLCAYFNVHIYHHGRKVSVTIQDIFVLSLFGAPTSFDLVLWVADHPYGLAVLSTGLLTTRFSALGGGVSTTSPFFGGSYLYLSKQDVHADHARTDLGSRTSRPPSLNRLPLWWLCECPWCLSNVHAWTFILQPQARLAYLLCRPLNDSLLLWERPRVLMCTRVRAPCCTGIGSNTMTSALERGKLLLSGRPARR